MTHVIYNIKSHRIVSRHATERGAKISFSRKKLSNNPEMDITTLEDYQAADTEVTVHDLLSNFPVKIRRSEVGTCCDPSTERYHAM